MEIIQNKRRDKETADQVAVSHGYANHDEFATAMNADLNSKNGAIRNRALDNITAYAKDLTELILQQVIEASGSITKKESFANQFDDGWLTEGNQRQYINTIATGNSTWDDAKNDFVPTKKTSGMSEAVYLKMYDIAADGSVTLADGAYQFLKNYTIEAHQLIPYFKSGTLQTYISQIRANMTKSWELFKFNHVATFILEKSKTFKKQVQGKGADMYDSMIEFLAEIENIQLLNKDFMLGDTKDIRETNVDDLIIIMHPENKSRLQTGILTQLFNAHLLNNKSILDASRITLLGKKLSIQDEATPIDVIADDYVDKNTIIVFDKRAFRFIYQLSRSGSQEYINNMTNQLTTHIWFTIGMLPWFQGFVYTNKNLSKLPSSPNKP